MPLPVAGTKLRTRTMNENCVIQQDVSCKSSKKLKLCSLGCVFLSFGVLCLCVCSVLCVLCVVLPQPFFLKPQNIYNLLLDLYTNYTFIAVSLMIWSNGLRNLPAQNDNKINIKELYVWAFIEAFIVMHYSCLGQTLNYSRISRKNIDIFENFNFN